MGNKQGVYTIVNKINGKSYYGSATDSFKKRFTQHRSSLKQNKHPNNHLQQAWNLYGENAFEFKVALICAPQMCLYYEQLFLDKYWDNCNNCYNICKIAGSRFGSKCSKETKLKMSKSAKGKSKSSEHVEKASKAHIGKKYVVKKKNNNLAILKALFNL